MSEKAIRWTGRMELMRAIREFQLAANRDAFNALRKGAYEASRSLMARTRRSKMGPSIAVARAKDTANLAERLVRAPWFQGDDVAWMNWIRSLKDQVYVARSDRPQDKGIRYRAYWPKDRISRADIRQRTRYNMRGLAKASWRWCASKAKSRAAAASQENEFVRNRVTDNCSVRADRETKTIIITNRLPYIRAALTSASAIDEALRAAAASMRGQAKKLLEKSKRKAGLAS